MEPGSLRFLCDEMLLRLGRWLRASGYYTVLAEAGQPDRALVEQACHEGRWLLTRDRKMAEHRRGEGWLVLPAAHGNHRPGEGLGRRPPGGRPHPLLTVPLAPAAPGTARRIGTHAGTSHTRSLCSSNLRRFGWSPKH